LVDASDERRARERKLAGLRLRCPGCRASELLEEAEALRCRSCGARYPVRDGRPTFHAQGAGGPSDSLDRLKRPYKRFRRLYAFLVYLVSPLFFDRTRRRFIDRHIRGREGTFINLGSGNTVLHGSVINVDIGAYDGVDLVCDILSLPLEDESVDVVLNISVLEHVPEPERVLDEIRRVLRPGGLVYTDVPFVVGYHASPQDFSRWTHQGVVRLHHGFDTESVTINGGPTSALLWVFQEWLAIVLSFGSRRLHDLVYLVVMCLTFPFKFLDFLLKRNPLATHISSCFIYVGRKPVAKNP
jgi:SAM-dependent methyltransferase